METDNVPYLNHLVIFAPNWLGDTVMALPALADVRRASPRTTLTIAARQTIAPLFRLVGDADEVLTPDALAGRTFDAALLLPNSFQAALAAWRAGIRERWGYSTDFRRFLLTRRVAWPGRMHQAARYQHLVRSLGYPSGPAEPRLDVTPEAQTRGADALDRAGWDRQRPLVGLAPGAAGGSAKRWPPASFGAVAASLAREGIGVALVGSQADGAVAAAVAASAGEAARPLNLTGTDLPTLAGILS
jgi:heptosyltransferase-2